MVNSEQIEQALASNPILVTALNRVIGYEQGTAITKQAYAEKRPLLEVALEVTGMDETELKRLLDPQRLTGKETTLSFDMDSKMPELSTRYILRLLFHTRGEP